MTKEQQRIAIAEACGWTLFLNCENQPFDPPRWLNPAQDMTHGSLPDYLNDLNAMHEAEKVLPMKDYWNYADITLPEIVMRDNRDKSPEDMISPRCATAAQRAEAFLRTLGRWVE